MLIYKWVRDQKSIPLAGASRIEEYTDAIRTIAVHQRNSVVNCAIYQNYGLRRITPDHKPLRGYTVRPSTLPLEASSSEGGTEEHGTSHFHALRVPVKFDTDGISTPHYSPPRRQENNFTIEETPHLHIHRVTCNGEHHPSGGQTPPTSLPLPPTSREDLRLYGYL
ncbi:uncharacterized protein TNCV_5093191 [Trichonephila clavipes]|nr:uncharacterized protein TNCV_5093191 [Trichonephila clavipes]